MSIMDEDYRKVNAGRPDWTDEGISVYAQKGKAFESPFRSKANSVSPYSEQYKACVRSNRLEELKSLVWRLSLSASPDGHRASNDHSLDFECPTDRKMASLGRVESECGTDQKDWFGLMPPEWRWPNGLNCLVRKNYPDNLFFVKHNMELTSAFCVDCRWLRSMVNQGKVVKQKIKDSLSKKNINTCDEKYPIPWEMAYANLYDFGARRKGTVVFVEHDRWQDMWVFMLDRLGFLDVNGCPKWDELEVMALPLRAASEAKAVAEAMKREKMMAITRAVSARLKVA